MEQRLIVLAKKLAILPAVLCQERHLPIAVPQLKLLVLSITLTNERKVVITIS